MAFISSHDNTCRIKYVAISSHLANTIMESVKRLIMVQMLKILKVSGSSEILRFSKSLPMIIKGVRFKDIGF